jgi:hypothetical protein
MDDAALCDGLPPDYVADELPDHYTLHRYEGAKDKRTSWRQRVPLSPPTLRRSTPITTTALRFRVKLDTKGETEMRLMA